MTRIKIVPALLAITFAAACGASDVQQPQPGPKPVSEVRLSVDEEVQLEWDGAAQLHAIALDAQGNVLPGRAVQWLTSKPTVFTVSQTGFIRAVGPGLANVTATIEGVPATVGVRVKSAPVTEVMLTVPAGASGLEVGETVFVGTRVKLASGQIVDSPLRWTSSDSAVAIASSNAPGAAAVVARGAGVAVLSGSIDGKFATVQLRITPKPTHDLIYSRWNGATASELFVLSLGSAGATPELVYAGTSARDPHPSPDGTQIVFAVSQVDATGDRYDDLYVVNRNGQNMRRLTSAPGMEYEPMWSPDGTTILFSATNTSGTVDGIWTVNADGSGMRKLTMALPAGVSNARHPAWSADGRRIAFTAALNGQHKVWVMNADGSGARQLTTDFGFDVNPTWSPDGTQIAFSRFNAATPVNGWDIVIVSAAGGPASQLELVGDQSLPAWSPDGRYIAVTGTAVAGQGVQNIYTLRPDGSGLRLRTVNAAWGGGISPAWVIRR